MRVLEKLIGSQLVKNPPHFMEPENSLPHLRHLPLSWTRSIQSMPTHPPSWRSIVIW